MALQRREEIVKDLIEQGNLKEFADLFLYVHKTVLAGQIGINYTRFLKLTEDPGRLRYEEAVAIARIFKVSPRAISELIHNQLEKKKK